LLLVIDIAGLSIDSLAAQAFVFFIGGFETSSTTMTFCLYELSLHQDIQERVREEIDVVLKKHDGKITYESIQEMEYLDKVVSGKAYHWQILKAKRIKELTRKEIHINEHRQQTLHIPFRKICWIGV
jgi:hypothetical protein